VASGLTLDTASIAARASALDRTVFDQRLDWPGLDTARSRTVSDAIANDTHFH
jgi:hypothetical protein